MENIKKLTTKEIVEYIELTDVICRRYEKTLMDYNGIITSTNEPYIRQAREIYDKCIYMHGLLLDEGEKRILFLGEKKEEKVNDVINESNNEKVVKEKVVKNVKSKKTKK